MRLHVLPAAMQGRLQTPPTKSYLLRAAALALLAPGESLIHNLGHSADEQVAISLISALGAETKIEERSLRVRSDGLKPLSYTLSCGESALALRLFAPIAALLPVPMQLEASGSLLRRPHEPFSDIFPALGVVYESASHYAPIFVQGPLKPVNITLDGSFGSQFATGLLIAYAAVAAEGVTIRLQSPKSKPYLEMTLALLARFGCRVSHKGYQSFSFGHRQPLRPATLSVPGDWSSAAYLLVAAALSGTLVLEGLKRDSIQADKAILPILQQAQCRLLYRHALKGDTSALEVLPTPVLAPFQCDLEHSPDIFPALAALAAFANGTSYISGLHRLIHKESNRAAAIIETLNKVKVACEKKGDTLCIQGRERIEGGISISGMGDHRMVMMAALLALRSEAGLRISGSEAVEKSFPSFFYCLKKVGISVKELSDTDA